MFLITSINDWFKSTILIFVKNHIFFSKWNKWGIFVHKNAKILKFHKICLLELSNILCCDRYLERSKRELKIFHQTYLILSKNSSLDVSENKMDNFQNLLICHSRIGNDYFVFFSGKFLLPPKSIILANQLLCRFS